MLNRPRLLLALPGLAFWAHLPIWQWVWPLLWGPGENWWPVLIQFVLFGLSVVTSLICGAAAFVAKRSGESGRDWITAAVINFSPMVLVLLLRLAALFMPEVLAP
jgi:hypothetical protein